MGDKPEHSRHCNAPNVDNVQDGEISSGGFLWGGHISFSVFAIPKIMRPSSCGRVAGSGSVERRLASDSYGNGVGIRSWGRHSISDEATSLPVFGL